VPSAFSIKLGDFLYKRAFPLYNLIYPVFKRRQDKEEIGLLQKNIRKGDTVLDIGANIGFYTKLFSGLAGDSGKVYAFEPDPTNFKYLEKNTRGLKNVVLYNKAVSDHTGTITLYKSTMLNVDHKTYASGEFSEKHEIPCVAIDDLLPNKKIDFIKIDIQGYEYYAFKGMNEILSNSPGLTIVSEFFPYGIKQSGVTLQDFLVFFSEKGFNVTLIGGERTIPVNADTLAAYEHLDAGHYFNIFIKRH
jgi:FkbM family methyltransferase